MFKLFNNCLKFSYKFSVLLYCLESYDKHNSLRHKKTTQGDGKNSKWLIKSVNKPCVVLYIYYSIL